MSVLTSRYTETVTTRSRPPTTAPVESTARGRALRIAAAVTRLSLGWIFVWAFLDKLFGLGHETASKDAWINGGHPTQGFLKFAASGPFKGVYNDIAGAAWADWLFMLGLIGIGAALVLGVTMRMAVSAGVLLLVLMWTAVLPPENNVFMDDHLVYAGTLVVLLLLKAGHTVGFGRWWEKLPLVQRFPFLR